MVLRLTVVEELVGRGHENIKATHRTTLEITKDGYISPRADCVVVVGANKSAKDLSDEFKRVARNDSTIIVVEISVGGMKEVITGRGSSKLTFTDEKSMVVRKSDFTCGRTLAVRSDKAAADLNRRLVELLRSQHDVFIKIKACVS